MPPPREPGSRSNLIVKPADVSLGAGYERIVTHLFARSEQPMDTYEKVRAALRLGTRASSASHGQLVDALDQAEENAMEAMELLINAKVAHDAFEIDAKMVLGAVREESYAVLQAEKAAGVRSKAITDADVESVMASRHPDDWQEIQEKIGKAKRTVDLIAELAERARERAKDLRAMVSKSRDA